jgi:hypothetical protein
MSQSTRALAYDVDTAVLTELVRVQAIGWDYRGRPNGGRVARDARRRAREIRAELGFSPPYSRPTSRRTGHHVKAYA